MMLDDWLDADQTADRLIIAGLSSECAKNAANCFVKAAEYLRPHARSRNVIACWAPGRIEVLGKHTDYCGGESILAAAERGFCMLATSRDDGEVKIVDPQHPVRSVVLDKNTPPTVGHWSNYPHTVVRRLAKNFPQANSGATIAFVSSLPKAAGMSSSSAFIIGTFLLLSQINDLANDETYASVIRSAEDLAGYLSTVENGMSYGPLMGDKGVGTFGGSEDHTAILCGQPGGLVQYSFCPVRFQRTIELDGRYVFAIASSGVIAEKTGSALDKYNHFSRLARAIVETWRAEKHSESISLAAIVKDSPGAADMLIRMVGCQSGLSFASHELVERLDHFLTESRLISAVPKAIDSFSGAEFGRLARASQEAGVRLLKNQTAETVRLVEIANDFGAIAASAFGAGFGGSVWALVDCSSAPEFLTKWQSRYAADFPARAQNSEFFATGPGIAARTFSD